MKSEIKKDLLKRFNYLTGHLQGVRKMIEEDRYCIDVIQQNLGVIAALEKVNEKILIEHLETCVSDAIKQGSPKERERVLKEIMEIFKKSK
jgi:CsoR family transcriptional regulator, copper-sensing transcriptional repressor